ncbi:hypothetical protein [Actinomadura macrotermitis]|uniref:DUF3040 domain-containing protein n=1 Tax=Actinomadura macrotermitis TaxID=2585200 RepID=A0A7K0BNA1_9ACTN|nr:hypothetical protein [Actinomadura macrotermitis]MQY02352.1 hypothetical protein [Actinomadura macrotermitis]
MQPSPGAPSVPEGRAAGAAWRALPKETRAEVLAAEEPIADPAVRAVAVGYARTVLARSPRRQALPLAGATLAVVGLGSLLVALTGLGDSELARLLPIFIAVAILLWMRNRMRARILGLLRVEKLNAPATAPAEPAEAPPGA